jgi:hypothetical protein
MIPAMASPGQATESPNVQFLVDSTVAMVPTAGPDGHLDYFNKNRLGCLGVNLDDVWKWGAFVHREDGEGTVAKWRACVETGENFDFETGVRGADGECRWMLDRTGSLRDRRDNHFHLQNLVDRLRANDRTRASTDCEPARASLTLTPFDAIGRKTRQAA